jgi:P27 family predicted phage terminase small subunit
MTMQKKGKRPPEHLGPDGRELWKRLISEYTIDDQQGFVLLQSACESFDRVKAAQAEIERFGLVVQNSATGAIKANPAATIERDARASMLAALKALRLDVEIIPGKPGRPQGR